MTKSYHFFLPIICSDLTFHQPLNTMTVECRLICTERNMRTQKRYSISDQKNSPFTEGCLGRMVVRYHLYERLCNTTHYLFEWFWKEQSSVITLIVPELLADFASGNCSMMPFTITVCSKTDQ